MIIISDWDFLWELEGEELEFAMATGMSYDDLAYLDEQEKEERKVQEYKKYAIHNRKELAGSVKCACYGCVSIMPVYHVTYDDDDTAICPICKRKTIVPYFDDIECYLEDLHDADFPDEDIRQYY
ncbi:MAG: hypothetical protein K2G88_05580 [Oscillospiraceae bacterium]|nr:hypothetical protein [Oscillospiraceae bacterium]MDE6657158.1 hypothetical protein [Oscillospiraceae bacterium]